MSFPSNRKQHKFSIFQGVSVSLENKVFLELCPYRRTRLYFNAYCIVTLFRFSFKGVAYVTVNGPHAVDSLAHLLGRSDHMVLNRKCKIEIYQVYKKFSKKVLGQNLSPFRL